MSTTSGPGPRPKPPQTDIDDYLEQLDDYSSVKIDDPDIIDNIAKQSGLNRSVAEMIANKFFQEIRNEMLRGKQINISNFGVFTIKNPKNGTSKERVQIIFKPSKKLTRMING